MSFAAKQTSPSGIIFSIKRYSIHDGPGIRTTVFFKGCPLSCGWCHNPEGISPARELIHWENRCIACGQCIAACPELALSRVNGRIIIQSKKCKINRFCTAICPTAALEIIGAEMTVPQVIYEIEKDTVFYEESGGGVTISGGEPLLQPSFLNELLRCCKQRDIHTTVDTCGYVDTDIMLTISHHVDVFLYDMKFIDDAKHKKFTGVSNDLILRNLKTLCEQGKNIIIRIPIIPGINDDHENIGRIANFLKDFKIIKQIDILPYHHEYLGKKQNLKKKDWLGTIKQPSAERLNEIRCELERYDFKVVIGG